MILLATQAAKLRNGAPNAKTPPPQFWRELVALVGVDRFVQIGVKGEEQFAPVYFENLPMRKVSSLLDECETWVSPDSFLQHLAHHRRKPGVVVWSVSDPRIFGYPYNRNLLKDRSYLRANQFDIWDSQPYNHDAFVDPSVVARAVLT